MSIQYTVPGFEPTTFGTWVTSHNHQTRAPALFHSFFVQCAIPGLFFFSPKAQKHLKKQKVVAVGMTYFGHFNQPIIHNLTTTVIACFCFINVFLTTNLQIGNNKCRFSNHLWVKKVEAAKKIFSLWEEEACCSSKVRVWNEEGAIRYKNVSATEFNSRIKLNERTSCCCCMLCFCTPPRT